MESKWTHFSGVYPEKKTQMSQTVLIFANKFESAVKYQISQYELNIIKKEYKLLSTFVDLFILWILKETLDVDS